MKKIETCNILSTVQAYHNCEKSGNSLWYEKHETNIIDTLLEALPHGSGIDGKWDIEIEDKKIVCINFYHVMNSDGYYTHYIDFRLNIRTDYRDINGRLIFSITGNFGKCQDIKDYLYESIDYCLSEL